MMSALTVPVVVISDNDELRAAIRGLPESINLPADHLCVTSSAPFNVDWQSPGCVIAELPSPHYTGNQLLKALHVPEGPLEVVFVTSVADVTLAVKLMRSGATALVELPFNPRHLMDLIDSAVASSKKKHVSLRERFALEQRIASLDEEELLVLEGIFDGRPVKTLAQDLHVSKRTIDRRRRSILDKFATESISRIAIEIGAAGIASLRDAWLNQTRQV